MSIRRHDAKRDANEPEIVSALEVMGCKVIRMDQPCDLLVLHRGTVILVEVKTEKGRLSKAQEALSQLWPIRVLRSVDEAIDLVNGKHK